MHKVGIIFRTGTNYFFGVQRGCLCGLLVLIYPPLARGADPSMKHEALSLIVHDADRKKPEAGPEKPKSEPAPEAPPAIFSNPQAAASQAGPVKGEPAPTDSKDSAPAVELPKMEIYAKRLDSLAKELQANEWETQHEQNLTKPSELDKALNDKLHLPLFGGSTATGRAQQAEFRVHLLDLERQLIIAIGVSHSEEEKTNLRKFLEEVRSMRRGYGYGDTFRGGK